MPDTTCPLCKRPAIRTLDDSKDWTCVSCDNCKNIRIDGYSLKWLGKAEAHVLQSLSLTAMQATETQAFVVERNFQVVQTDGRNGIKADFQSATAT